MKQTLLYIVFSSLITLQLLAQSNSLDPGIFKNPTEQYRVHTWWHWMDNSISKAGITADLEAMSLQGISTATILNVGLLGEEDYGVPPVEFRSKEWFEMFRWALEEADRLGIRIGVHNCDGWSTTGGPWITPENSMKKITWRTTTVKGGKKIDQFIPEPVSERNFYRDAAVVAYKVPGSMKSGVIFPNRVYHNGQAVGDVDIVNDGSPLSGISIEDGHVVDFVFDKSVKHDEIMLYFQKYYLWRNMGDIKVSGLLLASKDGKTFQKLDTIVDYPVNQCINIKLPENKLKTLRLQISKIDKNESFGQVRLSEMNLLYKGKSIYQSKIPAHLAKIVAVKAYDISDFKNREAEADHAAVQIGDIIDISDKMDKEGNLVWNAPEGEWNIIRFGYTTTGVGPYPATKAGRGLECDKMDAEALKLHFNHFPMELVKAAGHYTGNTFGYIFVDSWECQFQNWTAKFIDEFYNRTGYSIIPFIPAICGTIVEDPSVTEKFFHDFQKTIAGLLEDEYYRPFKRLCNDQGLEFDAETIYGDIPYPPLDVLKNNTYVQNPMTEYWARADEDKLLRYQPVDTIERGLQVQASIVYNNPIVAAEAYTGFISYSEDPWSLKLYGDRAMCSGINRMVLHSNVHQPIEAKPGFTLGLFGHSFNRHSPWFKHSHEWFNYLSRAQYVLQETSAFGEVLRWIGDYPHQYYPTDGLNKIIHGINRHICNTDVLLTQAKVESGAIVLDNGQRYKILLLPEDDAIELTSLRTIEKLVLQGAVIYGLKPQKSLSNTDDPKDIVEIADRIWGNTDQEKNIHSYGKGKVLWGMSLFEALELVEVKPDLTQYSTGTAKLMYYHKNRGNDHVFFIVNQEDKPVYAQCDFQLTGKNVQLWCPETGRTKSSGLYIEENGVTKVPLHLKAKQAVFLVFEEGATPHVTKVFKDKVQIFPNTEELSFDVPDISIVDGEFIIKSRNPDDYVFETSDGEKIAIQTKGENVWVIENMNVSIHFPDDKSIDPIETTELDWLTSHSNPQIKYYAGIAEYVITFDTPEKMTESSTNLYLDIGNFTSTCDITLNDEPLGVSVFPGRKVQITNSLNKKKNVLRMNVSNNYRNRIIGDYQEFGELQHFTTALESFLPTKEMPLLNTGLKGKIKLTQHEPVKITIK